MKKNLAIIALIIALPLGAYALEKPVGVSVDDSNVWDSLIVLITQLTSQIDALTAENASLRAVCTQTATVPQTKVFGSTQTTTVPQDNVIIQPMIQITEVSRNAIDEINSLPHGAINYRVGVTDGAGNYLKDVEITFNGEDNIESSNRTKSPNGVTSKELADWSASFSYAPRSAGTKTITVTSGSLTKTIEVVVE